jgi:hypothetical protein
MCEFEETLLLVIVVRYVKKRASYKYGIIKFRYIVASCWVFLYELYYDTRIHKRQVIVVCQQVIPSIITFLYNLQIK